MEKEVLSALREATRAINASLEIDALKAERLRLRRQVNALKAEKDDLEFAVASLKDKTFSQALRHRFVEDIKARLHDHGVYADHTRLVDERLFFLAFDEIVGMGTPAENAAIRKSVLA